MAPKLRPLILAACLLLSGCGVPVGTAFIYAALGLGAVSGMLNATGQIITVIQHAEGAATQQP